MWRGRRRRPSTNNGSDASVLLPTFRRAIIAFRAQLPLLYGLCVLSRRQHTHAHTQSVPTFLGPYALPALRSRSTLCQLQPTLRIPHVARPWLFSLYICTGSTRSLALSLTHSLSLSLAQLTIMLRLLLVVAALLCAHTRAAVTSQHQQQHPRLLQALGDAARALQRAEQSLRDATPSSTLTSVSVVQDWSLVCKELCG